VITRWLKARGFGELAQVFLSFGFYDLLALKSLTVEDLLGMGVVDELRQRVLLALVAQANDISTEHSIESVCLGRCIRSGVVMWELVNLDPKAGFESQWVDAETLVALDDHRMRMWLSAIATYESCQRKSHSKSQPASPSSEPPSPLLTVISAPTTPVIDSKAAGEHTSEEDAAKGSHRHHHRKHRHHRHRASDPPASNVVVIPRPKPARTPTPSSQPLPPAVATTDEQKQYSNDQAASKESSVSTQESNGVDAPKRQHHHRSRRKQHSGTTKDPLHVFVHEAMPNAPQALITAQLQALFVEGVFGLGALRALAQSDRWEIVAQKLAPQLTTAIAAACGPSHGQETDAHQPRTLPNDPPQQASHPSSP